jgi:hypothetical protein
MSPAIPGLVETSSSLAKVEIKNGSTTYGFTVSTDGTVGSVEQVF